MTSPKSSPPKKERASGRKARMKTEGMKIDGTSSGQVNPYSDVTFAKQLISGNKN